MWVQIRVRGHLDPCWQAWFAGLQIAHKPDGTSSLSGALHDQAALYGVLLKMHHLNVTLLALECSPSPPHLYQRQQSNTTTETLYVQGKEYHSMAISNLEKLIEDWALAWSLPTEMEKFTSLFTDDCVYEDVPLGAISHGKTELQGFYNLTFNIFPDFKMELTSQFIAGDRAGAEWILSGTHKGDFPGLPATNKHISVRGASSFELEGNKLKRCSDYWDMATALKQIGVLPS